MKNKKQGIIVIGLLLALGFLMLLSYLLKRNDYEAIDENVVEDLSWESFGKDKSVWKNHVLLGDRKVIFEADYQYQCLCYHNMDTGVTVPLCTVPDCEHNNSDICMAGFTFGIESECIVPYEGKIYGFCCNTLTNISVYRMNPDATGHEFVTRTGTAEGQYSSIEDIQYYVDGSSVYITVTVGNEDGVKMLESGYMSDHPCKIQIYRFDFKTKKIEKLYTSEQEYYQAFAEIRYIYDGVIYYDFSAMVRPLEEIYDLNTDELLDPDKPDEGPKEVHAFRIDTGEDKVVEEYGYMDYIGHKGDVYYFCDCDEMLMMSGDIRAENLKTGEKKTLHISELENKNRTQYYIRRLEGSFVVDVQGESAGRMIFYNEEGVKTQEIDNCEFFIIGEHQDMYLLSGGNMGVAMYAYIPKKEIQNVNRKAVCLEEER